MPRIRDPQASRQAKAQAQKARAQARAQAAVAVEPAPAPVPGEAEFAALRAELAKQEAMIRRFRLEKERRMSVDRLRFYQPYPKQKEFHQTGRKYRERGFMAGNQLGKTLAGSAEMAMHLTGRYPDWWKGRIYDRPIRAVAGSESAELTRDGVQRLIVGNPQG